MKLKIRVVPNSNQFKLKETKDGFVIYTKSKAEKGKANIEIVQELKRRLRREVRILSGVKSRKKVVEIGGEEKEILEKFKSHCSE